MITQEALGSICSGTYGLNLPGAAKRLFGAYRSLFALEDHLGMSSTKRLQTLLRCAPG